MWTLAKADFATYEDIKQEVQEEIQIDAQQEAIAESQIREIKSADYQLGKTIIDAFGKRVRMEEYLFKPEPNQYKFLVLNFREKRLDYYYDLWKFNSPLPDNYDIKKILWNCANIFFSGIQPTNWLTEWDTVASNTLDNYQWLTTFGTPVKIEYKPWVYNDATNNWEQSQTPIAHWVPESITDKIRIFATDGSYDKVKEYWSSTVNASNPNAPIWTWEARYPGAGLANQTSYTENDLTIAWNSANTGIDQDADPNNNVSPTYEFWPMGELEQMPPPSTPLYFWDKENFKDNTWIQFDFHVINNQGKHYTLGDIGMDEESFGENLDDLSNVNFELVIQAKEFEGRKIDIVIDPSIFFTTEEADDAAQVNNPNS
jgi:hypothetical protein